MPQTSEHRDAPQSGYLLIQDPAFNKGTAFTTEERDRYGIRGLLPSRVFTPDEQMARVYNNFRHKQTDLEKYIYLMGLQDRNETLFYRLLISRLDEMMPIVYTPTVGLACQLYGRIFRRPRGLYISQDDRGSVRSILNNWPEEKVKVIVVTDGERILGLGDLGAQGMGIPVGKLSLYTACAGIHFQQCLPITIDVGTNNESLRNDPLYIGMDKERLRGQEYDDLIHEFITACVEKYGENVLVQFEDFGGTNAFRLLEKYKLQACTFNDDIQGTASVSLAGVLASLKLTKSDLKDQRILFLGAGEAGTGIGELVAEALMLEGMDRAEAYTHCWFVDSKGLVVKERLEQLKATPHKVPFAHDHAPVSTLLEAINDLKPTVLIGVSGQGSSFTQEVVEAMCKYSERPCVFALSNPTSKAECTAEQAINWSKGKAIFASGSPFAPVTYNGKEYKPGQGNNAYIFPGVGLGVVAVEANRVNQEMFMIAAKSLAAQVSDADLATDSLYPPLQNIREVSLNIAVDVAECAFNRGFTKMSRPADLKGFIREQMFAGDYEWLPTSATE